MLNSKLIALLLAASMALGFSPSDQQEVMQAFERARSTEFACAARPVRFAGHLAASASLSTTLGYHLATYLSEKRQLAGLELLRQKAFTQYQQALLGWETVTDFAEIGKALAMRARAPEFHRALLEAEVNMRKVVPGHQLRRGGWVGLALLVTWVGFSLIHDERLVRWIQGSPQLPPLQKNTAGMTGLERLTEDPQTFFQFLRLETTEAWPLLEQSPALRELTLGYAKLLEHEKEICGQKLQLVKEEMLRQ